MVLFEKHHFLCDCILNNQFRFQYYFVSSYMKMHASQPRPIESKKGRTLKDSNLVFDSIFIS